MSEYIIQHDTLVEIADAVRTMAGTEAALTPSQITTNVQNANSEVENQTTLLAQAIAALEGKTAGGGSAAPVLQNKTVTPTISSQTVTPDSGYDGLARVTVNAIPSNYEDVADETEVYTDSLDELESVINSLPDADDTTITLQEKTATPSTVAQNILPDSGYDGLSKVTVAAMPTATQATPSITVSSAGLITASATQTAGYVAAGTKTATKQLTVQAAQTITPGTSNKTIASGRYLTGTQTIKGDANLVAANIAAGVSIFGVTGTHSGGTDTSDATATAADIVEGETAYVNGVKLTGTNPYEKTATDTEVSSQATKLAELKTILQGKASGSGGGGSSSGIETCTIILAPDSDATVQDIGYTYVDNNGKVTSLCELELNLSGTNRTIENIVCGSLIYILATGPSLYVGTENIENLDNYNYHFYKAPTTSGSTGTFTFIGDE